MAMSVPVNDANTSFALALLKRLSEDDSTGNVFFSPFSISAALAMVMLGAAGNTAAQMSEVLGFTRSKEIGSSKVESMATDTSTNPQPSEPQNVAQNDIHAKFAELLRGFYKDAAPYDLNLANRLYGEQSYEFVKLFLEETKKFYSAELESVDFKSSAEEVRLNINGWVEKQTQGKVENLLLQGVVDNMTRLVLVNAIYFKGKWAKQFKEEDTVDDYFRINKTETKRVKMMRQITKLCINTIPEVNSQILELPYIGEDLSMFIILPNGIEDGTTGLEKVEKELTLKKFVEWTDVDKMGKNLVEVSLPRFKMEEKYDLNDVLKSMGMTDAFDVSWSDFSGMSSAKDLVLSKMVHKSFVDVNEEGPVAADVTGGVISYPREIIPIRFFADHPFLFFIQYKPTKSILFAGRCSSPE